MQRMGKWIVIAPGVEAEYATYYPAEQHARTLDYSKVIYQGVRGMEVTVFPLLDVT
jgi:hypothetical protein